ncbi:MAG: tetratricopeptide repeat protein [Pseudomonadota bacterium]
MFDSYGSLLQFKARMLSYGSFVWVQALFGENIPLQRGVNVVLHLGTCWALYRFFALLLPRIAYAKDTVDAPGFAASQLAALRVGVLVFALHPVAAYAVGYLIQRSIVMATLFGVLACWAFVLGLVHRKPGWQVLALLCFGLAVLSKEHAFLLAALLLPLYVFVARPNWQRAVAMLAVAAVLLGLMLLVLVNIYPDMLGHMFDSASRELAAQLDRQRPGAVGQIFALSVLNEAALFFYYGALWLLPYPGWMSIDMHPPFPLTLTALPQVVGALAYVVLLVAATAAVLRKSDVWGFVGLCLLFPLVLFWTEFATVWVQDPFVLYRSYLWAIPIPALVAVLLTGFSPGTLYKLAVVIGLVLSMGAAERVLSMRDDMVVWTDAVEKTALPGSANAVGRARPFVYRGMDRMKRFEFDRAISDFRAAQALGAVGGEALFEMAVANQALGRSKEALQLLQQAQSAGFSGNVLYFYKGEAQYALHLLPESVESYSKALSSTLSDELVEQSRSRRSEGALQLKNFALAKTDLEVLVARHPKQPRYLMGLGLARLGLKDLGGALETFNALMAAKPDALAFYGRALAQHSLGNKVDAQADIAKAVQLDPGNAVYRQVQESIKKGEPLSL